MRPPVRIGNASGFYGDRSSAFREMLTGGPLDVLTGDYLAELTMLILARDRLRDPDLGYAKTFLRQLEESLGLVVERGVKVVVNAGGLNPAGLAARVRELSVRVGLPVAVGHVEGDDDGAPTGAVASNTYLGCWGIVECLRGGADVVVTGRVTDASLVVGPAAWHHGWARDDWDALAGATVAGHVLECGAQATGGNYSFFRELDVRHPGFPLAEVASDGSAVITKHPGTGGAVTVDTVTAQLLYEIGEPRYAGPDVVSRFDTIRLRADGADRVRISGVRGEPPPPTLKVGDHRAAAGSATPPPSSSPDSTSRPRPIWSGSRSRPHWPARGRSVWCGHSPARTIRTRTRRRRRARCCTWSRRTRTRRRSGGPSPGCRSSWRWRRTRAST